MVIVKSFMLLEEYFDLFSRSSVSSSQGITENNFYASWKFSFRQRFM